MTAPELIVLKQPGQSLTLNVMSCVQVPVGRFPEMEFTGTDGSRLVAVRVPKASADRQLARIDLTYQATVGKTLTFSRDPNPGDASKPYWGVSLGGSVTAPATNGKAKQEKQGIDLGGPIPGLDDDEPPVDDAPALPTSGDKLRAIFKLHGVCFAHALKLAAVAAQDEEMAITPTLEGVSALCTQAFIAATQKGV